MLKSSSGGRATETRTEEREEEFDSDWEIVEEYVRGEEACFPKWFFEYDAPVDPPTQFSLEQNLWQLVVDLVVQFVSRKLTDLV